MANEALALRGIDAYYGDSHVLHGVDLVLGEARLLGLLGRNGAGKTTCMAVAMGILRPRGGQVTLFGEEVTGRPPEDISARGVALVPQGRRIFKSLTMIELPRAVLRAEEIAQSAEFFSFGTNDLTQTCFGLSRDDSGSFLDAYLKQGIFEQDPFVSIDQDGVGELMRIGIERGRKGRPKLKLGICGEHGGDPPSVRFCAELGLDYVSCSPYRVPIARLAAAQAALAKEPAETTA